MKTVKAAVTTLKRDIYGSLNLANNSSVTDIQSLKDAREVVVKAATKGLIDRAYNGMEWERINSRIGSKPIGLALHHEIYDISADGKYVLVCERESEGTRYGQKTNSKTYSLLTKIRTTVKKIEINQALVARNAKKSDGRIGDVINVLIEDFDKKAFAAEKTVSKVSEQHAN